VTSGGVSLLDVISFNAEQPENADPPIEVTELEMETEAKLLQE
jgi:hypothetical protein